MIRGVRVPLSTAGHVIVIAVAENVRPFDSVHIRILAARTVVPSQHEDALSGPVPLIGPTIGRGCFPREPEYVADERKPIVVRRGACGAQGARSGGVGLPYTEA